MVEIIEILRQEHRNIPRRPAEERVWFAPTRCYGREQWTWVMTKKFMT